jgi:hypothetical protein
MRRAERPGPGKNKHSAPLNACVFERGCEVVFADDDGEKDKGNIFKIVAYSGQIIPNHWWWGNVAFDLAGIKFAKAKTPVLQEHFSADRIGFSTKQDIDFRCKRPYTCRRRSSSR